MKKILMILLLSAICLVSIPFAFADLTINLVAVNGSEEVKEMDIKSYLPKELEPTDVLDPGGLTVQYDVDKGAYFVTGKVTFQPKESKTFKIKVSDVWKIRPEAIDVLRKQADENLRLLEGKPNYGIAKEAQDLIVGRLEEINTKQETYSQDIERRIEQYRAYAAELHIISKKIYAFDYLSLEANPEEELPSKTIKFILEVKNPSETQEKEVEEKHYLPKEIRAENVVDSQGFEVRWDDKKEVAYLSKKDTFKPGEVKKHEIIIQDIWMHPTGKLNALQARAQKAFDEVSDSLYTTSGEYLFTEVTKKIEQIRESQNQDLPIKEHIGLFRVNTKRYADTEELVDRMEHLMAIVRAKKLEDLDKTKVKNVLQKLQALKGLAQLSEALFKKGLSMTTVWRIIFATLGFVAFFTTFNFVVWTRRSATMGEDKAGKEPIKEVPKPGAQGAGGEKAAA